MTVFIVAIHPDDYTQPPAPDQSDASSPRWASLLEAAGHRVRWVNVRHTNILEQLQGCQAFMWRWAHFDGMGRIARRLLPVIEHDLGLVVYPDQNTCRYYDDKIGQAYLFQALGIPTPPTWIWFDRPAALAWAASAEYPLVLKLATGAGSGNVRLVNGRAEAEHWINALFSLRLTALDERDPPKMPWKRRARLAARILARGTLPPPRANGYDPQSGYVMFQAFAAGNDYDTRVTVIGNRAFAFRRLNRAGDFRASGSGRLDYDQAQVDPAFIRLGYQIARATRSQSCAIDGLYLDTHPVVSEISYTYVSWAVHDCPGHWVLHGDPADGKLEWVAGHMWPEEAQIEDLLHHTSQQAAT